MASHQRSVDGADWVLPLQRVRQHDIAIAGGKAANLGELITAGLPVPPGFVITTAAYRSIEASDPGLLPGDDPGDGTALRARWERVEIPRGLSEEVRSGYRALAPGPEIRVAVRSSATTEDLAEATFAGQQDTFLDITGEDELLDAVRRCWASLWTERAIGYRADRDLAGDVALAVVVQQMVPAAVAGVLFTADPVTGNRDETVIDASPGLGEAVVSGSVTPEHYRLDARGRILEHRAGRRETVIGDPGTAAATGELPAATLQRLHDLGRAVEDHYQHPMDIEWARQPLDAQTAGYPAEGVWLVQARPLTGLPPEPATFSDRERAVATVLSDYLPTRPYPIDVSTWFDRGPAKWLSDMFASLGLRMDLSAALPEVDGVVQSFRPQTPRPTVKIIAAPLSIIVRALRYHPTSWRSDRRYLDFRRRLEMLAARDVTQLSWIELHAQLRMVLDAADRVFAVRTDYLPRAGLAIGRLTLVLRLFGRGDLVAGLLAGAHTSTQECNRRLVQLAQVEDSGSSEEFDAAFDEFLTDFGHRETASPLLITAPTWGDDPETVRGLIEITPCDAPEENPGTAAEAELFADRRLRRILDRRQWEKMIKAARTGIEVREDTHFEFTRPIPLLRQVVAEIGARLVAAGVIDAVEDVNHLRRQEIERFTAPDRLDAAERTRIAKLIAHRKAARQALGDRPFVQLPSAAPTGDALITGSAASAGVASGAVRVISSPRDFGRLRAGEILVCPYTNPAWTPLFRRAAAVVVDSGGVGSHAAIVAREYGIPAVMGTGHGSTALIDGQRVTVDGNTGRVVGT